MSATTNYKTNFQNLINFTGTIKEQKNELSPPRDLPAQLSHEELISFTLLELLEDRYNELDKDEKDALVMMLIENEVLPN